MCHLLPAANVWTLDIAVEWLSNSMRRRSTFCKFSPLVLWQHHDLGVGHDGEGSFASLVISNHYSDAGDTNAHEQSDQESPVSLCPCSQLTADVFHTLLSSASARPLVRLSICPTFCNFAVTSSYQFLFWQGLVPFRRNTLPFSPDWFLCSCETFCQVLVPSWKMNSLNVRCF
jgi:hypothetical protein